MKAVCIVCERTGDWAHALRVAASRCGAVGVADLQFVETRSPREAEERIIELLRSGIAAALVIEATPANAQAACKLLTDHRQSNSQAPRIAVVEPAYEWLLRESGAEVTTSSPRNLNVAVETLARFASQLAAAPPADDAAPPTETIWKTLPWKSSTPRGG